MKKTLKLFGVMLIALLVSLTSVDAKDIRNQIVTGSSGLGDSITFEKTYNAERDVTEIHVKLLVSEESIDTVLNQKAGAGSTLSIFYFSLNPNLTGSKFKKNNVWIGDDLKNKTYEAAMESLQTAIAGEAAEDYSEVWPNALSVQYSIDGGSTWVTSDTKGDSNTSIKADLMNKLGLTDEADLEYGKNYRISMYDEYTQIYGWDILDENGQSIGKEYITVDWEIAFPVAGKIGKEQILFISLEDAVEAGSEYITINDDVVVTEDVTIPENVILYVTPGATLEIAKDVEFKTEGIVLGDVEVDGVKKVYNMIIVDDVENGSISVGKETAGTGDEVVVKTEAVEGYELKSLVVKNADTDEVIEVKDGKFIMPEGEVFVTATFEEVSTVANPNTSDNVIMFVVLGLVALTATVLGAKKFKKAMN